MRTIAATAAGLALSFAAVGCGSDDAPSRWDWAAPDPRDAGGPDQGTQDAADGAIDAVDAQQDVVEPSDAPMDVADEPDAGPCPPDMVLVASTCMDRYEAPNRQGALPLVMFHFDEAASWCQSRGKRLCFDDEWTRACGGPDGWAYPYGETHEPGVCNDDQTWLAYQQSLLSAWPWSLDTDPMETLDELLDAARATGSSEAAAADHVQWLYQATPSGSKTGCSAGEGAYDLAGNIEEWTRRRSGGTDGFHGNLKGRYWAEDRTCQQSVITHGDLFRFYEIGFRCCLDPP